jgi:hypothetical protein
MEVLDRAEMRTTTETYGHVMPALDRDGADRMCQASRPHPPPRPQPRWSPWPSPLEFRRSLGCLLSYKRLALRHDRTTVTLTALARLTVSLISARRLLAKH